MSRVALSVTIGAAVAAGTFAAIPAEGPRDAGPGAPVPGAADPPHEGRMVFARMGCGSCHRLAAAGTTGTIGPSLDERLVDHGRASLVHSIVRAPRAEPSYMPADYASRMTEAQLDALVTFLLAARPAQDP